MPSLVVHFVGFWFVCTIKVKYLTRRVRALKAFASFGSQMNFFRDHRYYFTRKRWYTLVKSLQHFASLFFFSFFLILWLTTLYVFGFAFTSNNSFTTLSFCEFKIISTVRLNQFIMRLTPVKVTRKLEYDFSHYAIIKL